ncbi:period circadian protein homolog 2 isoform X2 [Nerophis ophidion]|uniref:period circadian protein homolog 2 isoform X2 n=1 Tax=Nerophis ophidion TaxID=159077 RepID=UPI002ADF5B5F|nr:period circadian protein homolog 2 isoform X2 [Nerophis ophidion]
MSEDSDSKHYCFSMLEDQDSAPARRASTSCSSMAQLQRMNGYSQGGADLGMPSEGSDSSGQEPPTLPRNHRKSARSRSLPEEDAEMKSTGSSGSGSGNESHSNESNGLESVRSSNSTSKDSALLESSESNKSSNSHSPSPPSSSNAFSLLSSEQDNPSTSGCSSQESAKAKTQKELLKTLKELKRHVPAEKRHNSKSTTLNTLEYALRCVKQVEANEEYYQLLMTNDSQPSGLDVSSYTIDEIDSITSEYTLKNNDIFAVAVSLITGKIVYISDQAASILNCKREVFKDTKFVEFLIPQDVSVFYSFTTPYRLPSWSMCTGADSSPPDCMQEKSFFCRISGGKKCKDELQYYPFRMTPYLMKVQVTVHAEDQFCCLLLAERVHSGYDAPRIPTDKRIFTTTHSPSCVFQDVDERAVPLLGYLPQDLIGTSVLLHLHPNDRPMMLAIHRKILQYAGQPFDQSSIRFCARNGEYVILDTSWSSFVSPWSRKVSFVIGRHKVRTGPVNEDVFMAPVVAAAEQKTMDSDIQEITEQIHRLLLQPVHNSGSSSYRSLNSTDPRQGMTSSGENLNNGNCSKFYLEEEEVSNKDRPRTFQEICKGIHLQKSQEQSKKVHIRESVQKSSAVVRPKDCAPLLNSKETGTLMEESRSSFLEEMSLNDQTVYSYQQISCLDSVIRYLENCNVPIALKRKCQSSSNTTSSNSDEDKHQGCFTMQVSEEIIEDVSGAGETVESAQNPVSPPCAVGPPCQERESYKKRGLTKQSLAAHTQKEEQAFLNRFREHRKLTNLNANCSQYLERQKEKVASDAAPAAQPRKQSGPNAARRSVRNKKTKLKRAKQTESSDSTASHQSYHHPRATPLNHGLNPTSWSLSDTPQSTFPVAYPAVVPGYPLQVYPRAPSIFPRTDATVQGFADNQGVPAPTCPPGIHQTPYTAPIVTPFMAVVLPNFMYPSMAPGLPPAQPVYLPLTGGFSSQAQAFCQTALPPHGTFMMPPQFSTQTTFNAQNPISPQVGYMTPSFYFPPSSETQKAPLEGQSRSSTPQSGGGRGARASPPLFQSRCSSPLNLLELELSVDRQDCTVLPPGGQGSNAVERDKGAGGVQAKEMELTQPSLSLLGPPGPLYNEGTSRLSESLSWDKVFSRLLACSFEVSRGDDNNSDANSCSSDMLDIILHGDSCSGTGSATSGSMGSRSNGFGTSASGTSNSGTSKSRMSASGTGSNSSKYFGSVDSSQNSQKVKGHSSSSEMEQSDHIMKYALQDQICLLMAKADNKVMMTYQLPSRDIQKVLQEDRKKFRLMQNSQPCFTEEQKRELIKVHPWMKKGGLPKAIDVNVCSCCDSAIDSAPADNLTDFDLADAEPAELSCHRADATPPGTCTKDFKLDFKHKTTQDFVFS